MAYKAIMSHDIDFVTKYKSVRNIYGAVKRGNGLFKSVSEFISSRRNIINDPYFTMKELIEINNKYNIDSIFYFMAGKSNTKFDHNDYNVDSPIIKDLIRDLKRNGAIIGLHPSYNSFNSFEILSREKKTLEDAIGSEIQFSRQHYLNHNADTFRLLAEVGIKNDSTIGPRECVKYNSTFNREYVIYSEGELSLVEQPFLMMDTHLLSNPQKMLTDLENAVDILKKNNGTAVIIWHNNNYETLQQKELYEKVLSIIAV